MTGVLELEREGAVTVAYLNRPEKLNALNQDLLVSLLDVLRKTAADAVTRVLIVTGRGRAFSAGADIQSMEAMDEERFMESIALFMRLSQAFRGVETITIAAVNGYALAGGLELALMCDLRIAGRSAVFGLPDCELGLSPTSGMTWTLPRIVGLGRAMQLTLLGEQFDAVEAERIGLVNAVAEDADLLSEARTWANKLAGCPREALAGTKRGFYAALDSDFATATVREQDEERACFRSGETRKRFAEFLSRRKK